LLAAGLVRAQQPAKPVDMTPIDGETYYLVNQQTGLQADLHNGSTTAGDVLLDQPRSFTSLTQRWGLTRAGSAWKISNVGNGLCLDSAAGQPVQNPCVATAATQLWTLGARASGYYTLSNGSTGLALDLSAATAGASLSETTLGSAPTQSQQWLLRPAFFRGVDNALLEKQEANKVANGVPWWNDAGTVQDTLQILKNHGVNMIRIRPTSVPPYATYTSTTCTGNGCYAETDPYSIDLAKRAKALGMSVEISFLFDGGSSVATPGAWSSDSLTQAGTDLYNYVKQQVENYRAAGAMPDMVAVGNEVDTGFLSSLGTSPNSSYSNFATLQKQGMQAIADAAADTTIGPALPTPIRCIHVTPAYNLSSFFTNATNYGIPFDAMCQSYYPIYHGPLTAAQAAASNPNNKPVEQTVLTAAANAIGKPIYLIEIGEHYEAGFGTADPWYALSRAGQRQFTLDVDAVLKGLPNHLGMGMEWWDATGVNIYKNGGGYSNGDGTIDSIYNWNGLTLFDNADTQGYANAALVNYSAALPAMDAMGGKLDPTLVYKLVNQATGQILETTLASTATGAALDTTADPGTISQHQQWQIVGNNDGYFHIANVNASGAAVLDNNGSTAASSAVVQNPYAAGTASQEWNVVTAGGGYFALVNKVSGDVLAATTSSTIQQTAPATTALDWITAASPNQLWQILPVNITAVSTAAQLAFAAGTPAALTTGASPGSITVNVTNSAGAVIGTPAEALTLNVTGPQGYSATAMATSANGTATFNLSAQTFTVAGTYMLVASGNGLTSATTQIVVTLPVLTVTANNVSRAYGAANPALGYSFSGFVNGDNASVVTGTATESTTAVATSAPGAYPIGVGQGTLASANYTFSFVAGTLTVTQAATGASLAAVPAYAAAGTATALTATVVSTTTGTPTGSVNFLVNGASVTAAALNGGQATASVVLPAGTNTVAASYLGDSNFQPVTSLGVTVTISPQNVWVVNANGTVSELSDAGAPVATSAGGNSALAVDNAGSLWSTSSTANTLTRVGNTGAGAATFSGGGLNVPLAVAIDGSGNVIVVNTNNSLSVFTNAGAPVTGTTGYADQTLGGPAALAIDRSGSLWVANSATSTVTRFLGAADPVATPLQAGTGQAGPGVRP
jgi:arabinogalactan endo-1,4-beta-galactosidase